MTFVERVVRWDFCNFVCTYVAVAFGMFLAGNLAPNDLALWFFLSTILYGLYNWIDTWNSQNADKSAD